MTALTFVAVAVLLQAVTNGYLSGNLHVESSLAFSAVSFATAALVFLVVDRVRRRPVPAVPVRSVLPELVGINVLTAVTFLGFYVSLAFIPASLASAVETAIGPLVVAVFGLALRRPPVSVRTWVSAGALLVVSLAIAVRWQGMASVGWVAVAGVVLALVAGVGAASIAMLSSRLGATGISPATVTAHRFHLTYLVAFVILLASGADLSLFAERLPEMLVLGACAVVVPLYLLQIGLQRASSLSAMALVTTTPGLTYLAQVVFGAGFDGVLFSLIVLVIVIAVACAADAQRKRGHDSVAA